MSKSTRVIVEALGWRYGEDQLELERQLLNKKCEGDLCDRDPVGTMRRETLEGQVVGRTEYYCERHLGDATSVSTFEEEGEEELPFSEGPDGDGREWVNSAADRPPAATRYE